MVREGMYTCTLTKESIPMLRQIRRAMFAELVFESEPDFDLVNSNSPVRNAFISKNSELFPKHFFELERLVRKLERDGAADEKSVSKELRMLLFRPTVSRKKERLLYELLMQLLTELILVPCQDLLTYNRYGFFERCQMWSKAKQLWVEDQILNPNEETTLK